MEAPALRSSSRVVAMAQHPLEGLIVMTQLVRDLILRAARYRLYARSFPDEKRRLALRVLAAKLEERARRMKLVRQSRSVSN